MTVGCVMRMNVAWSGWDMNQGRVVEQEIGFLMRNQQLKKTHSTFDWAVF